jgi:tetratricopeptide (TPR) repeat protein
MILFLYGCSVNKNTAFRRNYHALTTTFNVYFNANESFKKGYKNIEDSYQPDFSNIIEMYAVSDRSTTGVAKGDMSRTIEKCEKAIKEHSIRKKPKRNQKKARDPEYQAFYNKEEFNTKIDDVWMLMGKAKFYSNEYLAASAIFTYVVNHFPEDKLLVAEASIWKARCFKEMDWIYEAEDLLKKVSDDRFNNKLNNLYAGAYADLLIYKQELKEALPYLEMAIATEKDKKHRTRFIFIAGQIYQKIGNKEKAYEMYDKVISANPPYQMAFNARIRQTEVYTGDTNKDMIKALEKMAKSSKNKDYLDQIYYAMGNIYLGRQDTAKAIKNYITSVEKSTREGQEKAQSYIALGDLYYKQEKYMLAQPAYSSASYIIDHEHPDYERVSSLSLILDELAFNYNTWILQDSLQMLAAMPKEDRLAAINKVIQQIIEEEKEEQRRIEKERLENKLLDMEIENMAVMDQRALNNNQVSWYFDNKSTVERGKVEFQRKYGRRKLEDNWNRKDKAIVNLSDEALAEADEFYDDGSGDAQAGENKKPDDAENNPKRVEYYLRQIPFTEEQVRLSNEQIAEALFNMGVIYNEKLHDYPKSIEAFDEFARRFPNDPKVADAYFYNYRILSQLEKENEAISYRNRLITEFPESRYAQILSQPDFRFKLERMQVEQDSLYENTYKEFLDGNFDAVMANTAYMEKNYSVSPLIPKFLLLKSLSIGKSGDQQALQVSLNNLLERYPNSDVASMAKDILALMTQGKTPEAGTPGGLMALREETAREEAEEKGVGELKFQANDNVAYLFKLITNPEQIDQNMLLYETATYNFTRFLVKDFDIRIQNGTLTVSGLDNLEEALWYINGIFEDKGIQKLLAGNAYKYLIISEENNELINRGLTIAEYEQFYKDNIANRQQKRTTLQVELIGEEKTEKAATPIIPQLWEGDDLTNVSAEKTTGAAAETKPGDQEETRTENPLQKNQATLGATIDPEAYQAPKDLRKYKELYTYDVNAPHYFVIVLPKGGVDFTELKKIIDSYNTTSQSLLNLSVLTDSGKGLSQLIVVKTLPNAQTATSYLMQIIKNADLRNALKGVEYKNIVISHDNFKVLKESGNVNVYMELFNRLYLKR